MDPCPKFVNPTDDKFKICFPIALEKIMKRLRMDIALGIAIALLPIAVFIYVLWKLLATLRKWISDNNMYKSTVVNLHSGFGSFALLDASNDNNEVKPDPKELNPTDDYDTITKTIKNTFATYQTYNTALSNHYNNVRQESAPDIIDHTSLLPENDNW